MSKKNLLTIFTEVSKRIINKIIFIGDTYSINIELILKSIEVLKNKFNFLIIGNINEILIYLKKIKSDIVINEVIDPLSIEKIEKNKLNIFNISNKSKALQILKQLEFSNIIANKTKLDLITMPINKSLIKKKIIFNGITEYLSKINNKPTFMLMHGENFSVIPYTTHINPKYISKNINKRKLNIFFRNLFLTLNKTKYIKFSKIVFICYNPHCGESGKLGKEDILVNSIIKKNKYDIEIKPSDSAFLNYKKNTLFISTYHDQCLIPFKILNKKGINITLGLNYRRISPAHGTAADIIYKNKADNSSFLECMKI